MSAVELLQPVPGDIVLDLAAAPGGKSTQIAGKLKGTGLLIANEIHPARAKILSENIERMGIANAVVINASPDKLSELFPVFFDKIMLDAPCSGEGMFRKDPQAVEEWSVDHVKMCAARQMDILPEAVKMLKPGGVMAYSTCTFNREENEDTIGLLLEQYGELELLGTERIWPHRHKGEGHFVAILRKNPASHEATAFVSAAKSKQATGKIDKTIAEAMKQFTNFQEDTLPGFTLGAGEPLLFGDQLYWLPHSEGCPFAAPMLQGLKTPRPGLHLGMLKKNRFEPSHALALALSTDLAASASLQFDVNAGSDEIAAYLHGEALFTGRNSNGWVIVTVDGFPVGWGKESTGQLKNHYPKGLRWVLGVQSK